jgi:glycerol uptake facilitator-like aquaporin
MLSFFAEFFGVIVFVYVILATGNPIAIGATLTAVIYAVRKISGGHINPAVSVAFATMGKLSMSKLIGYITAQLLGAVLAVLIYKNLK